VYLGIQPTAFRVSQNLRSARDLKSRVIAQGSETRMPTCTPDRRIPCRRAVSGCRRLVVTLRSTLCSSGNPGACGSNKWGWSKNAIGLHQWVAQL